MTQNTSITIQNTQGREVSISVEEIESIKSSSDDNKRVVYLKNGNGRVITDEALVDLTARYQAKRKELGDS